MNKRYEQYEQDSLGNLNRTIDDVRGQAGMAEDDGMVTVEDGEEETEIVLMELPNDARAAYIYQIDAYNDSDEDSSFTILEADLDDDGDITSTTQRSVRQTVSSETSRTISYTGGAFTGDAIAVESNFVGDIGVGVYLDTREEDEPDFEQTNSLEV